MSKTFSSAPAPGGAAACAAGRRRLSAPGSARRRFSQVLAFNAGAGRRPVAGAAWTFTVACITATAGLTAGPALAQRQTVVVTGNPFGRDVGTAPVSVLSGSGLSLRRAGTLGETLDGLPGVSASGFGPNSSRPVIRGLDGDRVRLLDNGGASIDASNLSFDHATATDPLVAERIEVLRGPSALLYGGSATGGVVNSIDNRIPRTRADGLSGRTEVRLGGASSERSGAAVVEGGGGDWAWHADAFGRRADDQRVPRFTPVEEGVELDPTSRVRNSAARSSGGAVGGGWVTGQAHLGAAVETARNRYGIAVEPDVTIRMQRDRVSMAGEWRGLAGPVAAVTAQASHTRYQHEEVEGNGDVGTTFDSRGDDVRLQLRHASFAMPHGSLNGVFGVQAETLDFSALGDEAFVPPTRTRSAAVFALEEWAAGPVVATLGARVERVRVASEGDAADIDEPRFGAGQSRRYNPKSVSLAVQTARAEGWQARASVGRTERAPAYYELYADGVHLATAAYERGDPSLPTERSRHAEVGAGWSRGAYSVQANVFDTRYARFISLDATGVDIRVESEDDGPPSLVPEYAFRAVKARLRGFEVEARAPLLGGEGRAFTVDLTAAADAVRGDNRDSGEPLPRLAPRRLRAGLEAGGAGGWRAGFGVRRHARQDRVPSTDMPTAGYTLLDAWASGPLAAGDSVSWFARLTNATDRLALSAASIATVRGLSPLPGRALTAGLRARF